MLHGQALLFTFDLSGLTGASALKITGLTFQGGDRFNAGVQDEGTGSSTVIWNDSTQTETIVDTDDKFTVWALSNAKNRFRGITFEAVPSAGDPAAPEWNSDPVVEMATTVGTNYNSSLADDVTYAGSDPLTFSLVTTETWLNVDPDGVLWGTPGSFADYADSEVDVSGNVFGSFANLGDSDNSYEAITEVVSTNTSALERKWVFDVLGAELVTFICGSASFGQQRRRRLHLCLLDQ